MDAFSSEYHLNILKCRMPRIYSQAKRLNTACFTAHPISIPQLRLERTSEITSLLILTSRLVQPTSTPSSTLLGTCSLNLSDLNWASVAADLGYEKVDIVLPMKILELGTASIKISGQP